MTKQLIVAVFGNVDLAQKAARDFDALSQKDVGFTIENGVIAEKDAAGKLALLGAETHPFWGGVVVAITGGLLGMLGGPVGAVAGMTAGASTGLIADTAGNTLLDAEFVEMVSAKLAPGSVAVILEAKEATPFSVDNVVTGFGGTVFRNALG